MVSLALQFPESFRLPNLCALTGDVFNLKESNPHREAADRTMRQWFHSFHVYDIKQAEKFMDVGQFDLYASLSFPDVDTAHLETCLAFFLWAFSTDDLSDEGKFQSSPEAVLEGFKLSLRVLYQDDASNARVSSPYAAMFQDLRRRIRKTASSGTLARFTDAFIDWSLSQQILAMVEYALDIKLPDYVFEHPILVAMSEATTDIMTWPNDMYSFNKEQADGDYQNLVCIIMEERNLELQGAMDKITEMMKERVDTYLTGLENYVQGTIVWYCMSPRYFRGVEVLNKTDVVINLFK
ncbi:Alpha-muurolene synthase [Leucoagaricus sp. SymC.cos]|nr:Alpha-muurolene synthase [Leucoagaricus sp. SymC.cos]